MRNTTQRQRAALLLGLSLMLGACSSPTPSAPPTTSPPAPTPPPPAPPSPTPPKTTPPAAPAGLTAAATPAGVILRWQVNTEGDLAGYRVFRASAPGGPFELLTPQPITATSWTDTSAPKGVTGFYQVVAVNRSGGVSSPATVSVSWAAQVLQLQNLDGVPGNDRLVFSRIGSLASPPGNRVRDRVTLRVRNTGPQGVRLTGLPISGPWTVTPAPSAAAPLTVPAGGSLDLTVRFVAEGPGNVTNHLHQGSLRVTAEDGSSAAITLAGLWQSLSENNAEPSADQIRRAFSYTFNLVNPGTPVGEGQVIPALDHLGRVTPDGDEVISAYWQRADTARPVSVTQLAAYHNQGNTATINWYAKGAPSSQRIVTSDGGYGQSLLPGINGGSGLATATFTPPSTFGLNVDGAEWSDPTLNRHGPDLSAGCQEPCGHHLRFWPVKDSSGQAVANSYFVLMDYSAINYDYNDNVYLISNVKPAPLLVNVGGPTFTAPSGDVWTADNYPYTDQNGAQKTYTYYSPSSAIAQPTTPTSVAIAGTDNPQLYRTYRHNTLDTPLDQRVMTFNFPVNNGTYQVKLHFAELYWNAAGKRVFDVSVEGQPKLSSFDIWAKAGGQNRALAVLVSNVQVSDHTLTIQLKASVDFPSLSGIEVTR